MTKKSVNDRLAKLEKKEAQLRAQRQALVASMAEDKRKDDTRRKILLGAFLLERLDRPQVQALLAAEFSAYLTRERDQALFADLLKPATAPVSSQPAAKQAAGE
jgi:hypothetical protein